VSGTVTPAYVMQVELHDPFGTIVGRGEIQVDEQVYDLEMDAASLATTHVAMRVGKYVQADAPNPRLPAWMRLTRP
jgi:hypothetical protein